MRKTVLYVRYCELFKNQNLYLYFIGNGRKTLHKNYSKVIVFINIYRNSIVYNIYDLSETPSFSHINKWCTFTNSLLSLVKSVLL